MRLIYTRHAREQMAQRRIDTADVEAVLEGYYLHYTDPKGNPIYVGDVAGRRVKVVLERRPNAFVVITAAVD